MALTPVNITAAILAAGPTLRGPSWLRLVPVIGTAVFTWAQVPANLALTGVTSGATGSGSVTGKLTVPPNPLSVPSAAAAAGLLGINAALMAQAVGVGVATAFSASATYVGASTGVGSGTDISRVTVSNGPALVTAILAAAAANGVVGVVMPRIAAGFGGGIAVLLLDGTGVGVVTGPAGPLPAGGTSFSKVF